MSTESGGGGEKTYDPTPKRLEDARRRGDVPKSDETTTAAVYLGFLAAGLLTGATALSGVGGVLSAFLARADTLSANALGPGSGAQLGSLMTDLLLWLLPVFLVPAAAGLCALIAQRAVVFSGSKVAPKFSRLSPVAAVKNKLGPTGLVEFAKRVFMMVAVTGVALVLMVNEIDRIVGAAVGPAASVSALLFDLFRILLLGVVLVAVAIAAVDLPWVRFDHQRKLKMSLQELKDENKEVEGDPTLKGRRRRRAIDIATNRMLNDVPTADVVIVNPTHYAVALKWSRAPGSAPRCVAKGMDEIAATIRSRAAAAGVPIRRDPPTARALHASVEIGAEIPVEHYRAVAAAIRFAEDMRRRARERNGSSVE